MTMKGKLWKACYEYFIQLTSRKRLIEVTEICNGPQFRATCQELHYQPNVTYFTAQTR